MKYLATIFIILFAYLFLGFAPIHAQTNTYSCIWNGSACGLNPASVDCFPNYVAWTECVGQPDIGSCQRLFPCRLIVGPTSPPVPGPGLSPLCSDGESIRTPIGCLPFTGSDGPASTMIQIILNWGIGLASGIALFTLLFASFQIVTAAGDAKRVQAGRELLTASIGGLILIVMGVVLLNFLGVTVLGLDALGFKI